MLSDASMTSMISMTFWYNVHVRILTASLKRIGPRISHYHAPKDPQATDGV